MKWMMAKRGVDSMRVRKINDSPEMDSSSKYRKLIELIIAWCYGGDLWPFCGKK